MSDPIARVSKKHVSDPPLVKVSGKIDMILGLDNYDLIRGREIRSDGEDGEPVAILSKLGLFVRCPTGEADTGRPDTISVVLSQTSLEES